MSKGKEFVFNGLRISFQMEFEKLLAQLSEESAKRVSKWWADMLPDSRELINQMIEMAYIQGKVDASGDLELHLQKWMAERPGEVKA